MDVNNGDPVELSSEILRLKTENKALKTEVQRLTNIILGLTSQNEPTAEQEDVEPASRNLESNDSENARSDDIQNSESLSVVAAQNPFLMEDILEVLAKFLRFRTLKNTRLVCQRWNQVFTRRILTKGMMKLNLDIVKQSLKDFEAAFPSNTDVSKRFRGIRIKWPQFLLILLTSRQWITDYGPSIHYLELGNLRPEISDWEWEGLTTHSLDIESILLKLCPNLKELVIPVPFLLCVTDAANQLVIQDTSSPRVVQLDYLHIGVDETLGELVQDDDCTFGRILALVFGCISSLKSIKLVGCLRSHALSQVIDAIEGKTEMKILEGLDTLNIANFYTHPGVFMKLLKVHFRKLRKLKVGRLSDFQASHALLLFDLLNHVKPNLEELVLGMRGDADSRVLVQTQVPHMPELKVFKNMSLREWFFESISFVLSLPKLQKLILFIYHLDTCNLDALFAPPKNQLLDRPHMNLSYFVTNCLAPNAQVFELVTKSFPNLEHIGFRFDGKEISSVLASLSSLKNLKHLDMDIRSSLILDQEFNQAIILNIPKFQALRKLVIRNGTPVQSLTEELFTEGFFKAPCLTTLELWRIDVFEGVKDLILQSTEGSKLTVVTNMEQRMCHNAQRVL